MKTALLIADLEGIAGVDHLEALAFGGDRYPDACAKMTLEVNAAIEGLHAAGYGHVRVSDSHRSGSGAPNLAPHQLPDGAELRCVDPDPYGGPLLDGVDAVCCVGMHAAGGTNGFAAHTVQLHTQWLVGGKPASETELVYWLAAERGVPAIFTSGDDVLQQAVGTIAGFVRTKVATGLEGARSVAGVPALLRAAAASAPVKLAPAPSGPLVLRLKNGARLSFDGPTFAGRYLAALKAIPDVEVEEVPGTRAFAKRAAKLLVERWKP